HIQIWYYLTSGVENIVFLKNDRVIGQIKSGSQEKMWQIAKRWIAYARKHPEYQANIEEYISDITHRKLRVGMTREEICLAWGNPLNITYLPPQYALKEEWVYEETPYQKTILTFEKNCLTGWRTKSP
ncbi:unnamed protein product, partial [marine sediment metagenome]